jgi:hypothetical protein
VVTLRAGIDTGVRTGELLEELSTCPLIRSAARIKGGVLGPMREQSTHLREQSTELTRVEYRIAIKVHAQRVGTLLALVKVLGPCG